jgi:hypothetical protein
LLSPIPTKAGGVRFPLEEYLENLIVKNWAHIDFCKDLVFFTDEDGTPGQQYATDVGIIDLLATTGKPGILWLSNSSVAAQIRRSSAKSSHTLTGSNEIQQRRIRTYVGL